MKVFLFPGQGTQKVGMGKDLLEHLPNLLSPLWAQADQILAVPLRQLCFAGPSEDLRQMPNTQPAVFMCSYAAYVAASHAGARADVVTGHSLGEYSALAAAEVLDWRDVLRIVRYRGRLMAHMHQRVDGKMAAILGCTLPEIEAQCALASAATGAIVEVANHNEERQIVVSGQVAAVDALLERLATQPDVRTTVLRIGGAAHCRLMDAAVEVFARYLRRFTFREPTVDIISGSTGRSYRSAADIRDQLSAQLVRRVQWVGVMAEIERRGGSQTWELGPGKVLTGFINRNLPGLRTFRSHDVPSFVEAAHRW
ncbi:MAG: ACP S-malonyltransferase [Angustibacter sp.]